MEKLAERPRVDKGDAYFRLRQEIEEAFYDEANLLDERRFDRWLECFTEDLVYFMPMRMNVKFGQHDDRENTRQGEGISWFDEDKWTLTKRVEQILTGVHYAEEPLSRTAHLVTNVQVVSAVPDAANAQEVETVCRFLLYLNRVEHETYTFVGRRRDVVVRDGDGWKVRRREILLDQNVLLAKNITTFF